MNPITFHLFNLTVEKRQLKRSKAATPDWAVFLTVAKSCLRLADSALAAVQHRHQAKSLRLSDSVVDAGSTRELVCTVLRDWLQRIAAAFVIPVWFQAFLENAA